MPQACPLCRDQNAPLFFSDRLREYFRCENCYLVFVPKQFHLSAEQERDEYDKHENTEAHLGYRQFLARLSQPLTSILPEHSSGLDFGCGPGPVLSSMLQDKGFFVEIFDPFYFPITTVFSRQYDFVTATEVLEHLRQPQETLHKIWQCIRPGGYLGVMTKLAIDAKAFARWHYKNDPTHIIYFSDNTYTWLCENFDMQIVYQKKDVVIFRKNSMA